MAILVVMVFLPASVLAGTPLRLCVGEDGHRAIEFVLTADHQAVAVLGAECAEPNDHYAAPSPECTDSQLQSVAQKPAQAADLERQRAHDEVLSFAVLATIAIVPALSDVLEADSQPLFIVRRHSQLDALRTVVLLI